MNKLIKVAEELYKQIEELQGKLAFNLSNDDNETLIKAKCFISNIIDRKDNIVDLSEVWHNVVEKPDRGEDILIDTDTFGYDVVTAKWHSVERWASFASLYVIKRWAYLSDLLPKGGKE